MSESEIKNAVEKVLSPDIEFQKYNVFSLDRLFDNSYMLSWQVKRDMLCNIRLDVWIDSDGVIYHLIKTDACPDSLKSSFIDDKIRDNLIWAKIRQQYKSFPNGYFNFSIESATLSEYKKNDAIIYSIKVTDSEGFVELIVMVIS
jgi:predicted translin family RNA/ssDNA-binding protein